MQAIDQPIDMQGPSNPSDPKATVVHAADDASLHPRIPGYRVLRKLGQGGMATVYLATQESLDRPVSIKVMASDALTDETSKSRFENEARTIAKLSHPSIVSIYEVGRTADGHLYYIMPFLPNGDLAQRDLSNDEPRIVELLRALLSALDYAHARGIVHRDVKLENVLFDSANRPLLADFGIALSKADNVRITTAGLAVGSSGCMAPEQARGDAVDGRADLYSVGVLAFELLTGELPFRSSDAIALALMHAQKPIPRLPPAKRHWQGFIDRAMAKSPDARFQNAQQMIDALDRIGQRTGSHLSGRVRSRFDPSLGGTRWKRPFALALGGSAALAAGLYAIHDRLPSFGTSDFAPPPVIVIHQQAAQPPGSTMANPTIAAPLAGKPAAASSVAAAPAASTTVAAADIALRERAQKESAASDSSAPAKQIDLPLDRAQSPATTPPSPPATGAMAAATPTSAATDQRAGLAGNAAVKIDEPGFVPLHDAIGVLPAAAIARAEVTRHEYAQFVNATRRQASACSSHKLLAAFSGRRNWTEPGFTQDGSDPVVCVSWDDANAYAQWLSDRSGRHYRLPFRAEWRIGIVAGAGGIQAGTAAAATPNASALGSLEGKVSEWLADCAVDCQRHIVIGRGWRERGTDALKPREGGSGFDDVGFRLVRVLGGGRGRNRRANANASASDFSTPNPTTTTDAPANLHGLFGRRHRRR